MKTTVFHNAEVIYAFFGIKTSEKFTDPRWRAMPLSKDQTSASLNVASIVKYF